MKRGEVWWVNFDSSVGGEIRKRRPAIILSIDASNIVLNRVQVVPISSQLDRIYVSEVVISLNEELRKAMADQLTTVSKQRIDSRIGLLSEGDLLKVTEIVKQQLGIS
jgi:mRNA interferase MazF